MVLNIQFSTASGVTLGHDDHIVRINNLMGNTNVGNVTGTITDNNGTYLLNGTGTQLGTGAAVGDAFTIELGTIASSTTVITEIDNLSQIVGTHTLNGIVTSVSATEANTIGTKAHINDGSSASNTSNSTSTIEWRVDEAVTPDVAAGIAGKGVAVYSAGLTGTVDEYATIANTSVIDAAYQTAATEDDNVNIVITGGALDSVNKIKALNKAASATSGSVQATITGTSTVTDELANGSISNKSLTITINNAARLSQYDTAQGATSSAVQQQKSSDDLESYK